MKLYIKNMVCNRCIMVITDIVKKAGFTPLNVKLGEVEIAETPTSAQYSLLNKNLGSYGFEIIDDKINFLIEKIKTTIIEMIHTDAESAVKVNHSEYISQRLGKDYNYLSTLFSDTQGITIGKYIIEQKIERVKELISYNELSLSEIADKTDYSSVQHLSRQFRKITGITPTAFKEIKMQKRTSLDEVGRKS